MPSRRLCWREQRPERHHTLPQRELYVAGDWLRPQGTSSTIAPSDMITHTHCCLPTSAHASCSAACVRAIAMIVCTTPCPAGDAANTAVVPLATIILNSAATRTLPLNKPASFIREVPFTL